MIIGKMRYNINVSSEFMELSINDEKSAYLLAEKNMFKQACYFLIQAMEKAIRLKVYSIVNPNIKYFRDRNKNHSLDSAIEFLIEIISTDNITKEQVSKQLKEGVLSNINYRHLHNNLRYPSYSKKYDSYSIIEIKKSDFILLGDRLKLLRKFLIDLHKFT